MFMSESILDHYCHFAQNLIRCILWCLLPYCYWILFYSLAFDWIYVRLCVRYSSHLNFVPSLNYMDWAELIYGTSFINFQTIFKTFCTQAFTKVCFYSVHSAKLLLKFGICKWCDQKDFYYLQLVCTIGFYTFIEK